jgi:hypothetical protein
MADLFGDGWGTAGLVLFDNNRYYRKFSPDCTTNPVVSSYCFNPNFAKDGDSVTVTVSGLEPSFQWEIIFQAYDINSQKTYTGSFGSLLTLVYHANEDPTGWKHPMIYLGNSEKLLSNSIIWYAD